MFEGDEYRRDVGFEFAGALLEIQPKYTC